MLEENASQAASSEDRRTLIELTDVESETVNDELPVEAVAALVESMTVSELSAALARDLFVLARTVSEDDAVEAVTALVLASTVSELSPTVRELSATVNDEANTVNDESAADASDLLVDANTVSEELAVDAVAAFVVSMTVKLESATVRDEASTVSDESATEARLLLVLASTVRLESATVSDEARTVRLESAALARLLLVDASVVSESSAVDRVTASTLPTRLIDDPVELTSAVSDEDAADATTVFELSTVTSDVIALLALIELSPRLRRDSMDAACEASVMSCVSACP